MNKRHPYNNIIERKLEQLPGVDADHLWNDMHAILDKKMPQKKERRRFIWWFSTGRGVFLISAILFIAACSSLYFLTGKENSIASDKKLSVLSQTDKINDENKKASPANTEMNEVINQSSSKNENNEPATTSFVIRKNDISAYNIIIPVSVKSKNDNQENLINEQLLPVVSSTGPDFNINTINLNSIDKEYFIAINHNKELEALLKNPETKNTLQPEQKGKNENGFYAGIVTAVDMSSIHFKSIKTGSTKGFIIGYALNNKWSVESGLYWDTKRVFDNGTYFNPPGYTPTSGIKITAVNGKSSIYEVPVNIKYNIITGKNNLFATSGLSSYLMKTENYDYEYTQNNQPGGHNYLSYKNETKNWLSVANFSLGYTHKLGATGSLRVEPYLKVPLKNIGVGNMPIMSTGLNIGFIKKIR